ncbi:NADH-quinone oxidoreductase subunit C [Kitasatospora sp. NPDC051705]|uniref:NADH-quinone oxidoreductase subunit C n=1 Tax=Kitasatospora sp. NPDC051705 TaxID=3364057 RepID=UPI0037A0AD8E
MNPAEQYAASVGEWATGAEAYGLITVDVPAEHWTEALTSVRDVLGLRYFDWLSAVDELADGFSVVAHLASADTAGAVRHLALRTRVPRDAASLPTAVPVYAGAAWHERETHEMFGIDFPGHPYLATLLLPDGFEGYPLRKEFVLAARVAKAWPGAKEPGESDHGDGPVRRKMQPPGVPDPNEWGPLKGTLPPVAERPARGARAAGAAARTPRAAAAAAGGAGAEGAPVRADRPRRTRSVAEGSASQAGEPTAGAEGAAAGAEGAPLRADRPRRTRSVSAGSVSQAAEPTAAEPTAAPAAGAPAEAAAPAGPAVPAEAAEAAEAAEPKAGRPAPARTQSSDAPWHNPVPAHAEPSGPAAPAEPAGAQAERDEQDETPARPADQDGDGA